MAVHDIQDHIIKLKQKGLGVLITDHNVRETLSVVDRAYIIDEGRVLSEGTREFLLNDPIAREIYLGQPVLDVRIISRPKQARGAVCREVSPRTTDSA